MPQKLPEGGSGASFGGGNRARTGGPELAKLVLYQLSYAPEVQNASGMPTPVPKDRLHGVRCSK